MLSGSGYRFGLAPSESFISFPDIIVSSGGESGCNVAEDDVESSMSDASLEEGDLDRSRILSAATDRCRLRNVCLM